MLTNHNIENRECIRVGGRGGIDLEPAFLNTGGDTTAIGQGPLLVGELSAVPALFSSVPGKLFNKTFFGIVDSDLLHYALLAHIPIECVFQTNLDNVSIIPRDR